MTWVVRAWARHFLGAELLVAAGAVVALVLWSERWGGEPTILATLDQNRAPLYGALVSLHGALLGFIIATAAITLGFMADARFAVLRSSLQYPTLWKVFTSGARWLGIAAVAALLALILDREKHHVIAASYVCAATTLVALLRLARCVWALEHIIRIAGLPSPAVSRT